MHLSCAPSHYKSKDVLLCAFSDISTRTQIENSLIEARRTAESANEAKSLFLATMSHEIRTPLHGVLGTLELLGRTQLDPQQKDHLQAIEGSSASLLKLISDVLDISKIEAGQMTLDIQDLCLLDISEDTMSTYSAFAQSKGMRIYACIDPQLPDQVRGDPTRVRQTLNNLLSNAIKLTDSGQVVLWVRVLYCGCACCSKTMHIAA